MSFVSVCRAFASFISINQLNRTCTENRRSKLSSLLNCVFDIEHHHNHPNHNLLKHILAATAVNLNASKILNADERRTQCTMFKKLNMWFDNWCNDLVKLGFVITLNEEGDILSLTSKWHESSILTRLASLLMVAQVQEVVAWSSPSTIHICHNSEWAHQRGQ